MRLEAKNLDYQYNCGRWILRNVSLHIDAGEVVGLAGPSGYGKTTLGRLLAGYEQPQKGEVLFNGKPLPRKGFQPVQLVFQHPEKAINPRWRLGQTLAESGETDAKVTAALGIQPDWLERWPNELSGGELQRFCVARALTSKTRFLVADEMTTMLDAVTQAQLWQIVLEYANEKQMGVLVISHEKELLKRLCGRIIDLPGINALI